ncbi:hypothetical protein EYF80_010087 [Liparis tanakae]|uniref:Uncharacterized protein n=1 Tax=Liparis tanakae TaxID=230148 RepID=A0A4Z2IR96_9TELE|nr:hypothetical protein EYF80_010087 [Liparis tanakae]
MSRDVAGLQKREELQLFSKQVEVSKDLSDFGSRAEAYKMNFSFWTSLVAAYRCQNSKIREVVLVSSEVAET